MWRRGEENNDEIRKQAKAIVTEMEEEGGGKVYEIADRSG